MSEPVFCIAGCLAVLLIIASPTTTALSGPTSYGAGDLTHVGSALWGPYLTDVELVGDTMFCGMDYGLAIWDVSTPTAPVLRTQLFTRGSRVTDIDVSGPFAYAATDDGLYVIDVSDVDQPAIEGYFQRWVGWGCNQVEVLGTHAYVFSGGSISVIDVSNPASPAYVTSLNLLATDCNGIASSGHHLYVSNSAGGFYAIDVDSVSAPRVTGQLTGGWAMGFRLDTAHAFVAVQDAGVYELAVVAISNPDSISVVGRCSVQVSPSDVALVGDYAYVTHALGVDIVNVGVPTAPVKTDSLAVPYRRIETAGGLGVFHGPSVDGGFELWNTSVPETPTSIRKVELPQEITSVAVSGTYAYVADRSFGLRIVDWTDPAAPTEVGRLGLPDTLWDVTVLGGYAYLAGDDSGLYVVDISTASAPVAVDTLHPGTTVEAVMTHQGFLFMIGGNNAAVIYDLTNPAAPQRRGQFAYTGAHSALVRPALAFNGSRVLTQDYGWAIVDVSNPDTPSTVRQWDDDDWRTLAVYGSHLHFSRGDWRVYDWTDSDTLVELSSTVTGVVNASHMAVTKDWGLLSGDGDLHVFDLSNPVAPAWTSTYPAFGYDLEISGTHVLVADKYGLQILQLPTPAGTVDRDPVVAHSFELNPNYPNPFNPATVIQFTLGQPADVDLAIFNVLGREVERRRMGVLPAGRHQFEWNGRDGGGHPVSSGVYFYRVRANGQSQTRRMMLLR